MYQILFDLKERKPEYFYENVNISKIFGAFPGMIWNGGVYYSGISPIESAYQIKNLYHNFQIPIKLTLTNPLLKKEDCYDRYCNKIVEIFETGENEILVASPILEEYLREKFPGYKYNRSIIASATDENFEQLLNKYNMIVLPRRKVKDFDYLNSIKPENRSRVEILCTDPCSIECPRLYSHYEDYAKATLYEISGMDECLNCSGFNLNEVVLKRFEYIQYQISYQEIVENYEPLGFTEFKISGRSHKIIDPLCSLIPYLIKPTYQLEIVRYILNRIS